LRGATREQQQELLRGIIRRITYGDRQAEIEFSIPVSDQNCKRHQPAAGPRDARRVHRTEHRGVGADAQRQRQGKGLRGPRLSTDSSASGFGGTLPYPDQIVATGTISECPIGPYGNG
jgi:hypothetical protein